MLQTWFGMITHGVTDPKVVLPAHGEHPVLLREPLERGPRVPDDVTETLQVQGFRARLHVGGEGLASPVDDGQILRAAC